MTAPRLSHAYRVRRRDLRVDREPYEQRVSLRLLLTLFGLAFVVLALLGRAKPFLAGWGW